MRELHVIGVSADGRHVLLAGGEGAARPTHAVALDGRLDRVLRGQSAEGEGAPVMSPKEIQSAIRAGASVEELAAETGMATTRVARYAGPVLGERERELATLLVATQVSRRGRSTRTLVEATDAAIASLAHLRPETVSWTAFRRDDGSWVARLSLVVRGRAKVAEWVRDREGDLRPTDSWATGLGHVEAPSRRSRAAAPAATTARKPATAPRAATAATAAKAAKANKAATAGRAQRRVTKTTKQPAKKAPARKVTTPRKATKQPAAKAARGRR